MTQLEQVSFAGGEITPSLYARTDLAAYSKSLAKCRNFLPQRFGSADNRPGLRFIGEVPDSSKACRLIPFSFNVSQTYVLALGDQVMRIVTDGGLIVDSSGNVLQVSTPWSVSDIDRINYVQSADQMWLTHPSYSIRVLTRSSNTAWSIAEYAFSPPPFQDINVTESSTVYITSISTGVFKATASASIFNSGQIGSSLYLETYDYRDYIPWSSDTLVYAVGDYRYSNQKIYQCTDMYTLPGGDADAHHTGATAPSWDEGMGWDGQGYYDSGTASTSYHIGAEWKYLNAGFGIGTITAVASDGLSATVTQTYAFPSNLTSSAQATYKWAISAFGATQGYPSAVGFNQERLIFANTSSQPQTVWMSKTNIYNDYNVHRPSEDADAVTFTVGSQEVNEIRHIVSVNSLLLLTSGGVWKVAGDSNGVITPSTQVVTSQSAIGASYTKPIIVGSVVLYIQEKGCAIRSLGYQLDTDSYQGNEISVFAAHLFDGYTIVDWAYAEIPNQIIYIVRSDGALVTLTYMPEQEVIAFALHDTQGYFESVAVVGEDQEDVPYFVVRRTINGATKRYIERLESRLVSGIDDAFFVDCGLTYDGRNTGSTTATITASDYTYGQTLTVTFSAATLSSLDVGKVVHITDPSATDLVLRCTIRTVTSSTVCAVTADRDVPAALQSVATSAWGLGVTSVSGLDHLNGMSVVGLADGNVLPAMTVASGSVSFADSAVVVHVGLSYTSTLQTLDITMQSQSGSLRNKMRGISKVGVYVRDSRGIKIGHDADHLREAKQRDYEFYDQPISLKTGMLETSYDGPWNKRGQIMVVQDQPLPASILGIYPEVQLGQL